MSQIFYSGLIFLFHLRKTSNFLQSFQTLISIFPHTKTIKHVKDLRQASLQLDLMNPYFKLEKIYEIAAGISMFKKFEFLLDFISMTAQLIYFCIISLASSFISIQMASCMNVLE